MSTSNLDLDLQLFSDFIYALNIARRQILSYPPGHPIIAAASEKLLALVPKMLEFRPELTIGIARNVLMVDGKQLDATNPVYRDFAVSLFDARIASLTIRREVTDAEIRRFFEIIRQSTKMSANAGGLDHLLAASGLRGIQAKGIDFGAFHATEVDAVSAPKLAVSEGESAVLWKAFVTGLVDNTLDPHGVKVLPVTNFDPVLLADMMNRQQKDVPGAPLASYEKAITDFLKEADRRQLTVEVRHESYDRLGQLIDRLSPELRRRFLNSTLTEVARHPAESGEMLASWPKTVLLDALEQVDAGCLQVPQTLLDVLGKLAVHRTADSRKSQVAGTRARSSEQTAELLGMLFQGEESNRFVPADYRDALAVLAAADVPSDLNRAQVDGLLTTLDGHSVERQFCAVMLDLVDRGIGKRSVEAVTRNLEELVAYFLESGDFATLGYVYEHLSRHIARQRFIVAPESTALRAFASGEFVGKILEGLDIWEKEQHPAIRDLIGRVGIPFVEPLIGCLAEESNMSRRRLFMECLQKIGSPALEIIIAHLQDPRWYVVRNLVILLREINDPAALPALRRLSGHPHPKVQFEVMRTLLHFKDSRAERTVLQELENRDTTVLINAVRLTSGNHNPTVLLRQAELLNDCGNSEQELHLKSVIIKSLAEAGFDEGLEELAAFIETRSLFASAALTRVKVEAISSLARYSHPLAAEIAERVQRKGSGDLARAAGQVCLRLQGRQS